MSIKIDSKASKKIHYDEEKNPYILIDGNRKVWITTVEWIENLMKLMEEKMMKEGDL